MSNAKPGNSVTVIYDGYLDNNEVFESSKETGPLEFTLGTGQVMADFEKNIVGMSEGETKTFTVSPEAGHGPHDPELIHTISKAGLKNQSTIKPGMIMGMNMDKDGQSHKVPATVIAVDDEQITVDFNHPLAGKALTYKVTLQSIKNAPNT